MLISLGSVPSSGRPAFEITDAHFRELRAASRGSARSCRDASLTEMPGGSMRLTQIAPSFSSGRNSVPSCGASAEAAAEQRRTATSDHDRGRCSAAPQHRLDRALAQRAPARFSSCGTLLLQQAEAEQRHQRQREQQRADQRRHDGVGHRREDASLVALQREDRHVRDDDDQHREQRRPPDFDGRVEDRLPSRLGGRRAAQLATGAGRCSRRRSPRRRR